MKNLISFLILYLFTSQILFSQEPDLIMYFPNRDTINLSDYMIDDKQYVISFWAYWCGPCIREFDALKEADYVNKWKNEYDTEFIAIAVGTSSVLNQSIYNWNIGGWDGTVYLTADQAGKDELGVRSIPHTFVYKNGEQIYNHLGFSPGDEIELDEVVTGIVSTSSVEVDISDLTTIDLFQNKLKVELNSQSYIQEINIFELDGKLIKSEKLTDKNIRNYSLDLSYGMSAKFKFLIVQIKTTGGNISRSILIN